MKLILASGSEWREKLVATFGLPFEVVVSGLEELQFDDEEPDEMVARLATEKARSVVTRLREGMSPTPSVGLKLDISPSGSGRDIYDHGRGLVIGADTVVVCEGEIIGKPKDREDARRIIGFLQGKAHQVVTGVCVIDADSLDRRVEVDLTEVVFLPMSENQIEKYLDSTEWEGKAGGYQIQREIAQYLANMQGSISNVIGLPLLVLEEMLEGFGLPVKVDVRALDDRLKSGIVDEGQ